MAITAAMVKELREMTGAGMMDCKKALNETNGNMDEAVEFLRKNGQAKAEKKASRIAAEGLCMVAVEGDFPGIRSFCCKAGSCVKRSRYGCIHGREVDR